MILDVKCHYLQASICGCILDIGDCTYVKVSHFIRLSQELIDCLVYLFFFHEWYNMIYFLYKMQQCTSLM